MNETDITEVDDTFEAKAEALDAFVTPPPAPIKRGVGWGGILPVFLLAGIGGAVGGWALTQYVMPNYIALPQAAAEASNVNLGPLTSRIETLEKKLAAQSSEMSFLSSEVKSGSARVTVGGVDETLDITPFMNRLNDLEARLANTEGAATGVVFPLPNEDGSAMVELGSLNSIQAQLLVLQKSFSEIDGSEYYDQKAKISANNSEINALKERVSQLVINVDENRNDEKTEVNAIGSRISQLEADVEEARSLASTPTVVRDTVLLPPFPRGALLGAMTAPRDTTSQSWLDKTLKKHISVRNPQEVAQAEETLDGIEALASSGDYAAALKLIDAMPSDVRSLANDWTRALKAELETRP